MELYLWSLPDGHWQVFVAQLEEGDLLGLVGQAHSMSYPKSVSQIRILHGITKHTGAKLGWGTLLLSPVCLSTANPQAHLELPSKGA